MLWRCIVCDFVYDERLGLPEEGIPPGTKFEDIPDDWMCPDCGIDKSYFEKIMVTIISAVDKNLGIGKDGELPWHYPEDMKFFVDNTKGKTVIMGRITYESIGKPLPKRTNIVVTSKTYIDGCITCGSLELALTVANSEDIMIIGGAQLYKEAINIADEMLITHIDKEHDADTFFPEIDLKVWENVWEEQHEEFKFVRYKRIR